MNKFEQLVRLCSEIVDDGALVGNWNDCTLYSEANLVAIWKELAPKTAVAQLTRDPPVGKCVVFDAGDTAVSTYERWRQAHPTKVMSFFSDYYPSVCARTFEPGVVSEQMGQGLVMFQTPRTGSHFIQGMISRLKDFGTAAEWIRPPLVEAHALGLVSVAAHLRRCAAHQRAFHKFWAASIVLPFLETLLQKMTAEEVCELTDFISNGHCFMMVRKNRTAQTWSQIRAANSGVFHIHSRGEVNSGLDEALQPIEKFWFWNLVNGQKIEDCGAIAHKIAGYRVHEIPYEETRNPISLRLLEKDIFGPHYDPIHYKLDPQDSNYTQQSTAEDAAVVDALESIRISSREINFKDRIGIEQASFRSSGGRFRLSKAGLDMADGSMSFTLWSTKFGNLSTIAIHFTASIDKTATLQIVVRLAEKELLILNVSERGPYCLFADGEVISDPATEYTFTISGQVGHAVLIFAHEVPVPFGVSPQFPWMRVVLKDQHFVLCRFER